MSKPSTVARIALAAVTGVMALSAGATAQAQPYGGDNGGSYYDQCRRDSNNRGIVGALLGAGIGATVGSQLAARGHRTDGSVLGGIVGAGVGASVGNSNDRYRCDNRGPYYSYSDTIAYREDRGYRSGRYDYAYYNRMRCRLVAAPVDSYGQDYRYVRVCPDRDGRYRITG
jgi:hypothetical protein